MVVAAAKDGSFADGRKPFDVLKTFIAGGMLKL